MFLVEQSPTTHCDSERSASGRTNAAGGTGRYIALKADRRNEIIICFLTKAPLNLYKR